MCFFCRFGLPHYFCFRWLKFIAPLTAHLQPQLQTVDVDRDAEFQCIVSGHPVHEIKWLHNGKPILRDNRVEVCIKQRTFHFYLFIVLYLYEILNEIPFRFLL